MWSGVERVSREPPRTGDTALSNIDFIYRLLAENT
jgi:hypothetical protein